MNKNVVYDKPFLSTLELLKKLEKDYKLAIGYTDFEFNLLETVMFYGKWNLSTSIHVTWFIFLQYIW